MKLDRVLGLYLNYRIRESGCLINNIVIALTCRECLRAG